MSVTYDPRHTGEVLDAKDGIRRRIVDVAQVELGSQGKGSPEVYGYWREVCDPEWSDAQVKLYAKTKSWCGGFSLWCLRQAGTAKDVHWRDGHGFVGDCKLRPTKQPLPGDIAYTDQPYQHYALVESLREGTLVTIDGNQPGVTRKSRPLPSGTMFYSIEPLLDKALGLA